MGSRLSFGNHGNYFHGSVPVTRESEFNQESKFRFLRKSAGNTGNTRVRGRSAPEHQKPQRSPKKVNHVGNERL
jgi:hypothetical protein